MSLRICSLASGSKGNCILVEDSEEIIVIDSGVSARRVLQGLTDMGFDASRVIGIVLTHEHSDHSRGVGPLSRRLGAPVYATEGTFDGCRKTLGKLPHERVVCSDRVFEAGGFIIEPFSTFHDASDPFALVIRKAPDPRDAVAVVTDLGFVSTLAFEKLRGCRTILFESNHDRVMLLNGPYPWDLKQRLMGRHGHLDNESSTLALERLYATGTRQVLLGHLSEINNTPQCVLETMEKELRPETFRDLSFHLTWPNQPSAVLESQP